MKPTPELHINKQVPAAEVGLCLVQFEALLGIQLPTQLLSASAQSPEQQDHRAPRLSFLPVPAQGSAEQCWASPSSARAPHRHTNSVAVAGSEPAMQPEKSRGQMTEKGHSTHTLIMPKTAGRRWEPKCFNVQGWSNKVWEGSASDPK